MLIRLFRARTLLSVAGLFLFSFLFVARAHALVPTGMGGPPNGQSGVPLEAMVDRQFDTALSGATLTVGASGTIRLQANEGNVLGGTATGTNLCLSADLMGPDHVACSHMSDGQSLSPGTWYTFTIMSTVESSTGAVLGVDVAYQFQTSTFQGGDEFISPPVVVGSVPRPGVRLPNNAKLRVYFEVGGQGSGTTMKTSGDGSVFSTDNVKIFAAANGRPADDTNLLACATPGSDPAHPTDCNMTMSGSELIITPGKKAPVGSVASTGGSALTNGSQYVLIIKGSTGGPMGAGGVRNSNNMGMPGGDYYVSFTATGADALGPTTKGSFPSDGATSVDRAIYNISIGFSESIQDSSVDSDTILLYQDDGDTSFNAGSDILISTAVVDYYPDRDEAIVSPTDLLNASTKYFVVITTNVKDVAGNAFDGDRSTGGNQQKALSFTTGTLTNGQATDNTKPTLSFANANNFSVAVTFSEPVKMDLTADETSESSELPFVVNNITNWTLESPVGVPVSLAGKDIVHDPSTLTTTIYGVMLPPSQSFRVKVATSTGAVKIQDLAGNSVNTTGSGNLAAGTVQNAMEGGVGMGGGGAFDFFSNGMSPIRVAPRTALAGATSMYEVEFPADTSIPSGGKIVLTFPTGFSFVADGGNSECQDAVNTIDNNDLNGPSTGTVTIASIACSVTARTVMVTTGGAATVAGDRVRFILQGIVNSTVPKDFSTSGYTVDIKTKGAMDALLETKTSMPFFLTQGGSQSIAGTVFNDNGDGGGTENDGTKNGTEGGTGISVKICMGGMMGSSCVTTSNGAYTFSNLSDGFYHVEIPPLTSGNYVGGPFFRDINLVGGQSKTGENFALRASSRSITVNVEGIPSDTDLDVFAFNPSNMNAGGNVVREVLWAIGPQDGTDTATIPVSDGTWEVGVGPWMPKDPSMGPAGMPDFNFMPPKPQQVTVSGSNLTITVALQSASKTIPGKVVDGAGNAIPNAFILARPATITDMMGGAGVTQSKSDGTFSVKVNTGVYMIDASIPGMPPSPEKEVTVTATTVYSEGATIATADDLVLKIAKGDRSISGRVLDDSGNPVAYAHVNAQQVDGSGNPLGPFMGSPTDSSGNFTIYVKDGTWKVFGFAPGFGQLPSLTVTVAGSSVTGQNLQATSSDFGTLTGSVLKGGVAVAGAFVNVHGSSGGNGTVSDTSGKYSLKVRAGAGYTIDGFVPGSGPLTPLTNVTVTANQTLTGQNLLMAGAGTIRVTISGVTDAFVEARDSSGRGNGTRANTTAGVYDIAVPEGTYTVRANQPRFGVLGSQAGVAVTSGNTTVVTFSPPSTYPISGTVSSSTATCVNGASVVLADTTNGRVTMTTTDTAGLFSISLPNGTYYVNAGKPGCIDSASPTAVTVAGAAVISGADRTLTASNATITGRVTLSGTGVSLSTKIMAQSSDGRFAFADVDTTATGGPNNYTLNVTPGTWSVNARSDGYESSAQNVTVTAGSQTANFALSAISGYTRYDPASSTVTPSRGGLVRDSNIGGNFELNIPAGALGSGSDSASVTTSKTSAIVTQTATAQVVGEAGVEITPTSAAGQTISTLSSSDGAGVTITIPYTDADVTEAGLTESQLTLAVWSEEKQQWEALATTVDTENNTLTAITTHFSTFAGVGPRGTTSSSTTNSTTSTTTTGNRGGGGGTGRRLTDGATYFVRGLPVKIELEPQVIAEENVVNVRGFISVSVGGQSLVFHDIPANAWYAPFVASVLRSGIATGYKDAVGNLTGEYGPGNSVTYAEIAKMALQSARSKLPETGLPKNRTARGDWSAPYILLAEQDALSVFASTLDIRKPATRGAVIQTIVEALHVTEPEPMYAAAGTGTTTGSGTALSGTGALTTGSGAVTASGSVVVTPPAEPLVSAAFTDVPERHPYSAAILLAAKLGIVSGDTYKNGNLKGTFRPNAPINRAEVAKIFTKLIELGYVK